jgi:hypothetical protein
MSAVLSAFGLEGTVTRPAPDDAPINATVVWLPVAMGDVPSGMTSSRREKVCMLSVSREEVPSLPRGSIVEAPEVRDGDVKTWKVDATDLSDAEHIRALVIEVRDVET